MALGPIVSFTKDELDLLEKLQAEIDSEITLFYNGAGDFSVSIQTVSSKIENELCRLYKDAGWGSAYFGLGSFKLSE